MTMTIRYIAESLVTMAALIKEGANTKTKDLYPDLWQRVKGILSWNVTEAARQLMRLQPQGQLVLEDAITETQDLILDILHNDADNNTQRRWELIRDRLPKYLWALA